MDLRRVLTTLGICAALLLPALSAPAAAQEYRIAKRLGGATTRISPPLADRAALKRLATNPKTAKDLRTALADAGLSEVADDVLATIAASDDSKVREVTFPVGGRLDWMAARRAGKVTLIRACAVGRRRAVPRVRVHGGRPRPRLHVPGPACLRQPVAGELRGEGRAASTGSPADAGACPAHRRRRHLHRRQRPSWPLRRPRRRLLHRWLRSTRCTRSSPGTSVRNVASVKSSWVDAARRCSASRAACSGKSARTGSSVPRSAWPSTCATATNSSFFAEVEANYVMENKAYIGTGLGVWDVFDSDTSRRPRSSTSACRFSRASPTASCS